MNTKIPEVEEIVEEFDKQFVVDGSDCRIVASYDEDDEEFASWRDYRVKNWLRNKLTTLTTKHQEELSQERTGFLNHIAELEKTHHEEIKKAVEAERERILEVFLELMSEVRYQEARDKLRQALTPTKTDKQTEQLNY